MCPMWGCWGGGVPGFTWVGVLDGGPCWPHTLLQLAQLHPNHLDGFLQGHLERLWGLTDVHVRQCPHPQIFQCQDSCPHSSHTFPVQLIWIPYTHPRVSYAPKYPPKHQTLYTLKPIYPHHSPDMPLYHARNPYMLYSHGSPSKSSESRPLCPKPPIRLIPAHSCPSASPVNARHPSRSSAVLRSALLLGPQQGHWDHHMVRIGGSGLEGSSKNWRRVRGLIPRVLVRA